MGNYQVNFCESWCRSRVCFESTLFIKVLDVLTEDVRDGSLMELLFADNRVFCGESLNAAMDKYGRWENAVEGGKMQ